jgi:hypothetical protein
MGRAPGEHSRDAGTIRAAGCAVVLVEICPDELAAWAHATGRVVDAEARLDFAAFVAGLNVSERRKIRVTVRHR